MQEKVLKLVPGGVAVVVHLVWLIVAGYFFYQGVERGDGGLLVLRSVLMLIAFVLTLSGYKIVNPNTAKVVQLFGAYTGTLRDVGFFWGNPFYWTTAVSLRVRTLETDVEKTEEVKDATGKVIVPSSVNWRPMKVNDKDGTPIEIAALVVWKVVDPTQAVFVVDDYEGYVKVQSDAALRSLASKYSYDASDADSHSLRGHIDEIALQLKNELQPRMSQAGVEIVEARITKLAYATEIASAMLQRQQAGAVIAARSRIVEGAVGMVEHALELLDQKKLVELDPERKAAMVSNLLVVLCGHTVPQPVINAGTLHN